MDIRCGACGEPWDNDELHYLADDLGTDYDGAKKVFRQQGCMAFGSKHNEATMDSEVAQVSSVLMEVFEDDFDGVAAMLEDAGF